MSQGTEFRPTINKLLNELELSLNPPLKDDLSAYRLSILRRTIFKKFLGSTQQQSSLEEEALNGFVERNLNLAKINASTFDSRLIMYMKDEFSVLFGSSDPISQSFTLYDCMNKGYCGPGSSVGTKQTDFLNKMFVSSLATTSFKLYSVYRDNLSDRWSQAEAIRLRHHSLIQVVGSKISTVPKDESKRRVICSEPVLNMFFQLGSKTIIEDCLVRHHNLDVRLQPEINKSLARVGSIDKSFSTIDLKDASDSITTTLMQRLLPSHVFRTLDQIRCSRTLVRNEVVELNMFSTMGNGFTFPLMTALFSCLVRAVYRIHDIHPRCGVNYSVFGDDIIVLGSMYDYIISALSNLGFIPNLDKSFSTGFFRESCGGDYFHGYNVRGVYIKELDLERPETIYSSINLLLHWSVSNGIDISRLVGYLLCHVPIRFVSQWSPEDSGIKCPRDLVYFYPRDSNGSIRFKRLEPVARRYRVRDNHQNPSGALICFLGGYVKDNLVTTRSRVVTYKAKKRVCPAWDKSPSIYLNNYDLSCSDSVNIFGNSFSDNRPLPRWQLRTFRANSEVQRVLDPSRYAQHERSVTDPTRFENREYAVSLRRSLEYRTLCMLDGA